MADKITIEQAHAAARNWADRVAPMLQQNVSAMGLVDSGSLRDSIRPRSKALRGGVYGISFYFNRYGIYLFHGVGRGRGISKKTIAKNKKGVAGKRYDWFNPIIKRERVHLADEVASVLTIQVLKEVGAK